MRLLNTRTLRPAEFYGDVPNYAILSHTWGTEEIMLQDLQDGYRASRKNGYNKISNCCEQAGRDGYDWIWIDSCCIDKSSSVELSEAINSQWSLYQNSKICYVHLADFSYIPGTAGETIHQFDQCRWFTRGWTLPELLAPSFVQFLDRDWNNIGTKSSLSKQISVITGIDIDALERRKTFSEFSVGCRMSWAARRRTTRPEDVAYCLLGLFDVNMPLIYGEGGENAFLRLQEEIMRIEEDYTLFVWNIFEGKPQTTGLLAKSPAEFTHMNYANLEKSPIQVFRDKFVATTIFSGRPDGGGFHMTSRGLRVCVPLRQVKEHSHQACLTCTKDSIASLICITLESDGARLKTNMHKDEPQAYFRIGSVDILAVADIGNYDFEYTTIYVRNFFESEIWKQRQKADSDGWRSWQVSVNHHDDDDSLNKSKALSTERAKAMFDLNPSSLESQGPALATSSDASYLSKAHKISTLAHSSVGHDREAQSENTSITTVDSENEHVEEVGLYGTATIYSASVDSDLAPVRDKGYITKLAEELSSAIIACETDSGTLDRISQMLPDLLRAFALKLGHNAPTSMHRDVSYFVHKYRRAIQGNFEFMLPLDSGPAEDDDQVQPGKFALNRFLSDGLALDGFEAGEGECSPNPSSHENAESDVESEGEDDEVDDEDVSGAYREIIINSPAYSWLIANLQRETLLTRANPDFLKELEDRVLSALPTSHRVSRRISSQAYKATFELDWDPMLFVREQDYVENPSDALERAITLTGQMNDAQAATTRAYLSQTWPTTGGHAMQLVTDVVGNTTGEPATRIWPDGTEVSAHMVNGHFLVNVFGTADSLVEVGQQFGWLGAALRSSQFEKGLAAYSPFIKSTRLTNIDPGFPKSTVQPLVKLVCQMGFHTEGPTKDKMNTIGNCWHDMFRNPVMVSGYPILRKSIPEVGIEMPLNMMTALVGSQRAIEFDGKIFLKGFSTMLMAIKLTQDILIWHYHYNEEAEKISYLDHKHQDVEAINLLQLETARHVVGWCSDSKHYAGAKDVDYHAIRGTGLPRPHAGYLLEKVSVSAGRNVAGGATFALSVKDIPLHLVRDGYIPQLRWMATKYVVLWDDVAHRGWLVNGTSALLHLVRASLEHYLTDDFSSLCLFDTSKLEESAHRKPNSAIEVLTNAQNMGLEIFPGKTDRFDQEVLNETGPSTDPERSKKQKKGDGYFLFEDLVEQTYRKLELIMAYQTYKAGENGKNLKVRVRKHLEGWDFADLAMDYDPHPRVATLQAFGYGWVDFVRSIDAISLFGCGFGDLIRPGGSVGLCPNWKSVPTGEYYLAASIADLNKIYERFGEGRLEPATSRPVGNLFWHSPGAAPVASCVQCRQKKSGQTTSLTAKHNHDPVQVFSPKRPFLPIRGPGLLEDDCAVIFGHSVSWGYHWSEDARRDLEEGDPPVATATTERSATAVTVIPNAGPSRLQVPPTPSRSSLSTRNTGESTIGPIRGNTPSANSDYSTPAQSLDETHQSPPVQSPSVHNTPGSIQPRLPDKSKIKDFLGRFKRPKKP